MKKFANIFGLVLCVCVLVLTNSRAVAAGPVVTIGNTPLDVNVTNPVSISGTPNVNVSNTVPVSGQVTVGNATSNPVPVNVVGASSPVTTQNVGGGKATHVGQPASSLVNLSCSPIKLGVSLCVQRVNSDGSVSSTSFIIPVGQALVLTDIEWSLPGSTPNATKLFRVSVQGNQVAIVSTVADANGLAAGQWHFATGIVVASLAAYLQGYLVPTQ